MIGLRESNEEKKKEKKEEEKKGSGGEKGVRSRYWGSFEGDLLVERRFRG